MHNSIQSTLLVASIIKGPVVAAPGLRARGSATRRSINRSVRGKSRSRVGQVRTAKSRNDWRPLARARIRKLRARARARYSRYALKRVLFLPPGRADANHDALDVCPAPIRD